VGTGVRVVVDDAPAGTVAVGVDDDDDRPDGPPPDWPEEPGSVDSKTEVVDVVDVDDDWDAWPSLSGEPREQAVPPRANTSNRTRSFTGAHHRAPIRRP
jgi:hypothetical protein